MNFWVLVIAGAIALTCFLIGKVVGRRGQGVDARILPEGADGWVSTTVLRQLANNRRVNSIRNTERGRDHYKTVLAKTRAKGYDVLTVVVDPQGKLALKDGHHRVLCALEDGVEWLPVVVRESRGIRSHGMHVQAILPELIRTEPRPPEVAGIGSPPPRSSGSAGTSSRPSGRQAASSPGDDPVARTPSRRGSAVVRQTAPRSSTRDASSSGPRPSSPARPQGTPDSMLGYYPDQERDMPPMS